MPISVEEACRNCINQVGELIVDDGTTNIICLRPTSGRTTIIKQISYKQIILLVANPLCFFAKVRTSVPVRSFHQGEQK